MSEPKTTVNDASVIEFLQAVPELVKREDSFRLLEIFQRVTGEEPKMWGSAIVGFGKYHYKSERSSQEGDWPLAAFSPRKQSLTLYMMLGFEDYSELNYLAYACKFIVQTTKLCLNRANKFVAQNKLEYF